jgi:methylmalonyl-CoA mutase N-terminal domain/subunit
MFDPEWMVTLKQAHQEWEEKNNPLLQRLSAPRITTDFGTEIKPIYTPIDLAEYQHDFVKDVGYPGQFPYTRGNTPAMYREQIWRIGQYAGFSTAQESNVLFKNLIQQGQTELALAFDLPTQLGYDPDHPVSRGEVGKVGISLASLRDWEVIFDGIDMSKVYVYSVSNAQAIVTIAMHLILAERQGANLSKLRGGMQNDVLKEYIARGNFIFPIDAGMRLATDTLIYCADKMPEYWTINVGGYHICEAGGSTVTEGSFTLAIALAYLDAVAKRGVDPEKVASKISFLMVPNHNRFFEEIGKFRACRRLWARLLQERYGIKDPNALIFRLYTHNAGSVMTRQQPETNITRSAIACVVGALSGAQNICLRTMDECLGIPSEKSQVIGIRSQQVVAYETGITQTVDPLGGSYYVEWLTHEYEKRIREKIAQIDDLGGMDRAIATGYAQKEIMRDAYELQKKIDEGHIPKVGLNMFQMEEEQDGSSRRYYRVNPQIEASRLEEIKELKKQRNNTQVRQSLEKLKQAAEKPAGADNNLMEPVLDAVRAYATMGEICATLVNVFGRYQEPKVL